MAHLVVSDAVYWNNVHCNVWPISLVISKTVVQRENLHQIFRLNYTNNVIIPNKKVLCKIDVSTNSFCWWLINILSFKSSRINQSDRIRNKLCNKKTHKRSIHLFKNCWKRMFDIKRNNRLEKKYLRTW